MANRDITRVCISKEMDDYLDNLSKKLTREAKWRVEVTKTEASKYLAKLLNKKSALKLRKKGKNKLEMDLAWDF